MYTKVNLLCSFWCIDVRMLQTQGVFNFCFFFCLVFSFVSALGNICGRPVSLDVNEITGDLYILHSRCIFEVVYLYVVSSRCGLAKSLASHSACGIPFRFHDRLDVDPMIGLVYFTSFSTRFGSRSAICYELIS